MDVKNQKGNAELDHIENEIRQIDQMIHSWANGRTLRFDPAHVKPTPQSEDQEPTPKRKKRSVNGLFFWLNMIAFVIPIGILAWPHFVSTFPGLPLLTTANQNMILIAALMGMAGANLFVASVANARQRSTRQKEQVKKRANRNQVNARTSA